MDQEQVRPLNIMKGSPFSSPSKGRPLSEINPMGIRRNSPSFNQFSKNMTSTDSSPFDDSPVNNKNSPLNFWKTQELASPSRIDTENVPQHSSPSLKKRSSLENLKKASFVKKSNMFAKEHESDYDPDSSSLIDRPLAGGRPLSVQLQGNVWGMDAQRTQTSPVRGHRRTDSSTNVPLYDPTKASYELNKPASPSKLNPSPQKSSLSNRNAPSSNEESSAMSDEDTAGPGTGSNTPRAVLRQPKSVTFDAAPPVINEYEMITPDPSSVASGSREGSYDSDVYDMDGSFERETSYEAEDSFDESLEDADKTPVVLPEDWRFMSPGTANTELADTFEDPFKNGSRSASSPAPSTAKIREELSPSRSNSVNSDEERRPLPPLPRSQRLSMNLDNRAATSPDTKENRESPVVSPPRPASMSKEDILKISRSDMPLGERLHLLSIQNNESEARRRESSINSSRIENSITPEASSDKATSGAQTAPHITKEAIMSKVKAKQIGEMQYDDSSPAQSPARTVREADYANLDPDVPIPSRETSSDYEGGTLRKRSDEEKNRIVDMYAKSGERQVSPLADFEDDDDLGIESSVIHHEVPDYDDYDEEVSEISTEANDTTAQSILYNNNHAFLARHDEKSENVNLPSFKAFLGEQDYQYGVNCYMTPTPTEPQNLQAPQEATQFDSSKRLSSPIMQSSPKKSPTNNSVTQDIATPESVIPDSIHDEEYFPEDEPSPAIPEPVSTIKTHGSKLKTRPSATPADIRAMAAVRRQVSGDQRPATQESEGSAGYFASQDSNTAVEERLGLGRRQSFKMKLEIPAESLELGVGIDQEFNRLLEAQKKGYMTRENEKVIVASTRHISDEKQEPSRLASDLTSEDTARETKSAGNSPRKPSGPAWTTEPWNGRMRRHSTRKSIISPEKKIALGPVPPLPGQESNVGEVSGEKVADADLSSILDEPDSATERGRLFVKVVKVKELDFPIPRNEPCFFQLTLDNGLHCVTTAWLELGKTAPIGQEFELVVFDDLEFQLTLQTKLERPVSQSSSIDSFERSDKSPQKSGVSKFFMSAKKRRELERKQQEQADLRRKQELNAIRAGMQPTAWDLQHDLVGNDGSFARAYISLGNHEPQAYGRPCTIDVPCFNEWSVDDKMTSTRSKLGGAQRRPPYKIGRLEVQLLYVPRPRTAKDEELPKSMTAASRQLKEAEAAANRFFEGHLSQQGGDCPYWRRRYFKLMGSELKAYHEHTRQPRAKISLAKATKIIDDKSALTKGEVNEAGSPSKSPKKSGRRKSAFAQDEEGYMFVEEGFRIRFANGEIIDFYADNAKEKDAWMAVLSEAIGKDSMNDRQTWTDLVLAREKLTATKAQAVQSPKAEQTKDNVPSSTPTSPIKSSASMSSIPKLNAAAPALEKPLPSEPGVQKAQSTSSSSSLTSTGTVSVASPSKLKQPSPSLNSTSSSFYSTRSDTQSKSTSSSPVKGHQKRNSVATTATAPVVASPQPTPRGPLKNAGRRQAVRSMIF